MTIASSHFTIISGQGARAQAGASRSAAATGDSFKNQLTATESDAASKIEPTIPPSDPSAALRPASGKDQINGVKVIADLNGDGIVDEQDLKIQQNAMTNGKYDEAFDHNKDGVIDSRDMQMITALMGTEGRLIVKRPDFDQNGTLNFFDIASMLQNLGTNSAAHDLDGDGIVDERDINLMTAFFPESGNGGAAS